MYIIGNMVSSERKQEKSSGVAKKRERMAAQGKTLGGDRIQKRVG